MRIALCFSGQPRFIDKVAPIIKENIIGDYNVDVFAHLWFDEELQSKPYKFGGAGGWRNQRIESNAIDDFKKQYNPKDLLVQSSKKFLNSYLSDNYEASLKRYKRGAIDNPEEPDFAIRDVNNITSYYYSLMKVCLLKKEYEYEHDFKYDMVIKIRTDSIVHNKIDYESFAKVKNTVFYSGNQGQSDGMINDWFNFGSSKTMDVFMSPFPVLDKCIDACMDQTNGAWCCELIHKKMVDFFKINSQPLPIHITLPRF
tara:strand:+ start:2695 stop:3462 length:768 start_codon:yes stop_codon:yes gene_type:complete